MWRITSTGLIAMLAGVLLVDLALAEPRAPEASPDVAFLTIGIFCARQEMDQLPAPGTLSGWIHVPDGEITFHWPGRQVVPATLGLAFGVKAQLRPGKLAPMTQIRIYRPGLDAPEVWDMGFGDIGPSVAFFRFDHGHELIPGLWRLEAWNGTSRLYSVEFEVVSAAAAPEIAGACGAVS